MPKKAKLFGPIWTILFAVSTFFAGQLFAIATLGPFLQNHVRDGGDLTELLQSNAWLSFINFLLVGLISLWIIYTLLKVEFGSNFKTLGINKLRLKHLAYTLIGTVVYFVILIAVLIIIKALFPSLDFDQKQEIGFNTTVIGLSLLPVFLSLVILPPITEEILARGFLFGGLRTKLPFIFSAILTSLIFALPHLTQSSTGMLWIAGIDTFILSLVLCYMREKTGSLWPSIGVHMIKNSVAFIILFNIVGHIR